MNDVIPTINGFKRFETNGGKGSGNFGHSGRPGKVGGSGAGRGSSSSKSGGTSEKEKKAGSKGVFDDPQYEAEVAEASTFTGLPGSDGRIRLIAKRYGKDLADVAQDIDDYPTLKKVKEEERRKGRLSDKESSAAADAYAKLGKKDKAEALESGKEMTREEIADRFYAKDASATDRAKLMYAVDKLYKKEGAASDHDAGDDLAYSKDHFLSAKMKRRGKK